MKTFHLHSMTKNLVRFLLNQDSLFFMDKENLLNTERISNIKIKNPFFIPVPIANVEKKIPNHLIINLLGLVE